MKSIFSFIKKYIFCQKENLIILLILSGVSALLTAAIPQITGQLLDSIIDFPHIDFVLGLCLAYLATSLSSLIVSYILNMKKVKMHTLMSFELNKDVIEHIKRMPYIKIKSINSSYFTQRINNDSTSIVSYLINTVCGVFLNGITLIVILIMVIKIHWTFALLFCVSIAIYSISYFAVRKKVHDISLEFRENQSVFFSDLEQQLRYVKFAKMHNLYVFFLKKLSNAFDKLWKIVVPFQRMNYLYSSLENVVAIVSQVILLFLGVIYIFLGNMGIGDLTILSSYTAILLNAIRYFFSLGKETQNVITAKERLEKILVVSVAKEGEIVPTCINEVVVNRLSLTIDDKVIFPRKTITFRKGNMYGIYGENGSGKTSFINTLIGLYPGLYSGEILYDKVSIEKISKEKLFDILLSVAEQESVILPDSLKANIQLMENYSDDKIYEVLHILNMDDFVNSLPNKLETKLGDNGLQLSGGECHKISIARVLLRNSDIMIFDEPTAALDNESSACLIAHLKEISVNKIIIVVSHDNSIKSYFDDIITFEESK